MIKPKKLWKTSITIWSACDPQSLELGELALDAARGFAYCSRSETTEVEDPASDLDWDGTEFFDEESP